MTFEETYDAHFHFVWKTLRRLGVPPADLADVAQEVFLVVHRRLPHFEHRSRVTTWLFAICVHAARDRRRKAHVRHEVVHAELDGVDPSRDQVARLERKDDLLLFEAGLRSMNLDQRAVFLLFEVEGERSQDIAEALEIPVGTVYSRLRLAREAFRRGVVRARARRDGPVHEETRS
jgi:RNA polymerase sigma-70 factor (ECF subfamily)